jgi:monoamine oxidase
MGKNAKLNVQFKHRFWKDLNCNGISYATSNPGQYDKEKTYQNTWDCTITQPGETGILVNFTGGDYSDKFHTSNYMENDYDKNNYLKNITDDFLCKLNEVFPSAQGIENVENAISDNWSENAWSRGSYSYWKVGEYCGGQGILHSNGKSSHGIVPFVGIEGKAEPMDEPNIYKRNCHFAGEHTSIQHQGLMNGAVESGNRVAKEILDCINSTLSG